MSESDIVKSEQSNSDDVLAAITSFNDPNIIVKMFADLGWNYSVEIKETLALARQNANLSIKFKAIRYLRELLQEAAEASGYITNVSSTTPNPQGGQTTFSAKRIAGILNPVKQIKSTEVKETQNEQIEERTEPDRDGDRQQGKVRGAKNPPEPIRDTGRAFPLGDGGLGGIESADGGTPAGGRPADDQTGTSGPTVGDISTEKVEPERNDAKGDNNPCVKTRPPTCDQELFPGISSAEG